MQNTLNMRDISFLHFFFCSGGGGGVRGGRDYDIQLKTTMIMFTLLEHCKCDILL